jgi:hypothetical protein
MLALRDAGVDQDQRAPGCAVVDVQRSVVCTRADGPSPIFRYGVIVPTDIIKFARNTDPERAIGQRAEDFRESLEKFRQKLETLREQAEEIRSARSENAELYTELIYSYRQGISIYSDSMASYKRGIETNFVESTGM